MCSYRTEETSGKKNINNKQKKNIEDHILGVVGTLRKKRNNLKQRQMQTGERSI